MNKQENYIYDHNPFLMAVAIQFDQIDAATDQLIRLERLIARRFDHEQPVMLGEGISIAEGGFGAEGGNLNTPLLNPLPATVIVVHDVDMEIGEQTIEREPHIFSAVPENFAKILALRDERQKLKSRIQAINEELLKKYIVQDAINEEWEKLEQLKKSGGIPVEGVEDVLEFPDAIDEVSIPEDIKESAHQAWY